MLVEEHKRDNRRPPSHQWTRHINTSTMNSLVEDI